MMADDGVLVFSMSQEEYEQACEEFTGWCLHCGAAQHQTEPDAQQDDCPECGECEVYGAQEVFGKEMIDFTD